MMQIITGKTGKNHVTAEDDRALHAATFGTGNFVLNIGSKFSANVETSNNIVISDGELMMNGTHARIRYGETETVVIENGTTGYNRSDLIVARYKKKSGVESVELAVIKGKTTSGTPTQPSYTTGNILEGDELAEMPLYSVKLEGVNVVSVTPLFTIVTGMNDVYRKDEVYKKDKALSKDNIAIIDMTIEKDSVDAAYMGFNSIYLPEGFTPSNTILLCIKHYPDTFNTGLPSSIDDVKYNVNDYSGFWDNSEDANVGVYVEFTENSAYDFNLSVAVKGITKCAHLVRLYLMKI